MSLAALAKNGEDRVFAHKKSATLLHPFVGILLKGDTDTTYWPHCTVTLVSPTRVLAARHCVKNLHGDDLKVFFPFEGIGEISEDGISEFCEESNTQCSMRIDDLVLLKLSTPFMTLPTAQLGKLADLIISGEKTIVGYGLDDGSSSDNGIKREGRIVLNQCNKCTPADAQNNMPSDDNRSLCFNFGTRETSHAGLNTVGNQLGDSGGPMLDTGIESHPVIGVARESDWTCGDLDQKEGQYVNLTHSHYRKWLSAAFCGPSCEVTSTEYVEKLLEIELARLDHDDFQNDHQIVIQPGAKKLIVTMNHAVGGWNPDPSDLDIILDLETECTRYVGVEVCTVDRPAPGLHKVSVKRIHKSAAYQMTAIALYENESAIMGGNPGTGNE